MKKKNGEILKCVACKNEFYVPKYRIKTAKFCSLHCQNHLQYQKWIFNCEACGKKCTTSPSRRNYKKKFCSLECREYKRKTDVERRKQSKICTLKKRGFYTSRQLRKYIFEFKAKKCEICGYDEYDFCLDLHHRDKNPTNNNPENISILCVICHRKLHKGIILCP